jgi:hypothetical protein
LLPEPENLVPRYNTPTSAHYSRLVLKKKSRIRINQGPRLPSWTCLNLPTYKTGDLHFLQNGYMAFVSRAYQRNKGIVEKEDVEGAWIAIVREKFEEWKRGWRLKERLVRALGKALGQVCFLGVVWGYGG